MTISDEFHRNWAVMLLNLIVISIMLLHLNKNSSARYFIVSRCHNCSLTVVVINYFAIVYSPFFFFKECTLAHLLLVTKDANKANDNLI